MLAVFGIALCARGVLVEVNEREAVVITRLGEPVRTLDQPGVWLRAPWPIERSVPIDLRRRVYATGHNEMLTRDRKNIVLSGFLIWEVADPLRFHKAVGDVAGAESRIEGLLVNAQIGVLGRYDLAALTSTDPSTLKTEEIEAELLVDLQGVALEQYGIRVLDVGSRRLSLPEENIAAVFRQMKAERKQVAARTEAEGEEEASNIRAQADLEAARIRSEAEAEAAKIEAEAEAEVAGIYAAAHREDPELYRFMRSLESVGTILGDRSTVILRTDAAPFDLLTSPGGR